jgi:hypothetical protein
LVTPTEPFPELPFSSLPGIPFAPGAAAPGHLAAAPAFLSPPQIAGQITAALVQTEGKATEIALAPEELGRVRLRLEPDAANPDRMVVMISIERPETLDLFRRNAAELTDALRQAGYGGVDIGFGRERGNDTPQRDDRSGQMVDAAPDAHPIAPAATRLAGASLDLRL